MLITTKYTKNSDGTISSEVSITKEEGEKTSTQLIQTGDTYKSYAYSDRLSPIDAEKWATALVTEITSKIKAIAAIKEPKGITVKVKAW